MQFLTHSFIHLASKIVKINRYTELQRLKSQKEPFWLLPHSCSEDIAHFPSCELFPPAPALANKTEQLSEPLEVMQIGQTRLTPLEGQWRVKSGESNQITLYIQETF